MRSVPTRRPVKREKNKKTLYILGAAGILIGLFLISFWVTGLVLDIGQRPNLPLKNGAEATEKPTYEQLEQMVIDKDDEINALRTELEYYRARIESVDQVQGAPKPTETPGAVATKAPSREPQPTPAVTESAAPTEAPAEPPTTVVTEGNSDAVQAPEAAE